MDQTLAAATSKPLPPEKAEELLDEVGTNWLYGQGMGATVLTVGTFLVFPPYGLYILGNSLISLAGYEPLYISNALPDEDKKSFDSIYDGVTSAPGQMAAAIAGEDFRSEQMIQKRMQALLADPSTSQVPTSSPLTAGSSPRQNPGSKTPSNLLDRDVPGEDDAVDG